MARTKIPLIIGSGIDRTPGLQGATPDGVDDLRNVVLTEQAMMPRRGIVSTDTLSSLAGLAMDDILAIVPCKRTQTLVIAAWSYTDRKVLIFTAGSTGLNATICDDTDAHSLWFTAETVVGRPIVFGAEMNGKVFLSHYYHPLKPAATYLRGKTIVYDPAAAAGSKLAVLNANLGGGAADVRFAGVTPWLNYVVGWGYGNNSSENRPEIVRVSDPENPLLYDPLDYFIAGALGDPALNCIPVNGGLLVLKEAESYLIFGYDRRSFGIKPTNDGFGVAGPHLAFGLNGRCYFWSLQGPRVSEGGESVDLAIPLELGVPEPADLAASGDAAYGHVQYDPIDKIMRFYFPVEGQEQTRVYALHMRNAARLRWSYDVLNMNVACAAVFMSAAPLAPAGYPDVDSTAHDSITSAGFSPKWVNSGNQGDESYEVWVRVASPAGAWSKVADGAVVGVGTTQNAAQWAGGATSETYDVAMRYRRGGLYNAGAENSTDPTAWPAASRNQVTLLGTVAAPLNFVEDSSVGPYLSAGRSYVDENFRWDVSLDYPWELWEYAGASGAVAPPLGSSVVASGGSGHAKTITKEVPPSGSAPGSRTYWLRYTVPVSDYAAPVTVDFLGP